MDEIEQRLRDATDTCIKCYDAWRKNPKETDSRESLMESVHELRKIAARLEIEIAVSERDEMASRPIPIPPHRSFRKGGGQSEQYNDDNIGNASDDAGNGGNAGSSAVRNGMRRRRPHGGGGQHQGGGNRPQGGDQD